MNWFLKWTRRKTRTRTHKAEDRTSLLRSPLSVLHGTLSAMPIGQLETFDDILDAWQKAERESDKRALWRALARGGWFRACREAACRKDPAPFTSWLDESDATKRDIITFNGDDLARMALIHLHCGLAVCNEVEVDPVAIDPIHDSPGFRRDLMLALADSPLRLAQRSLSLTTLLVDMARNEGVTAVLTLELIQEGSGDFYPVPELAFLRDADFQQAEINARAAVHTITHWPPVSDVRWRLQRRDGKPLTNLSGPSLGASFSLGICTLLAGKEGEA